MGKQKEDTQRSRKWTGGGGRGDGDKDRTDGDKIRSISRVPKIFNVKLGGMNDPAFKELKPPGE